MRSLVTGMTAVVTITLMLGIGACSADVSVQSRPQDVRTGRALAQLVADQADCAGFEDYDAGKDYWDFTCQRGPLGERTFTIRTVAGVAGREEWTKELTARGVPHRTGPFFVVSCCWDGGEPGTAEELWRFPGVG
ncbi:hypothetical protein [Pseudonocardia spinosispora]|uniref:hypothetical protein n=1 Tax=Pseudonocardia spinosispora TaxID=103441 RepID=UPI00040C442E|nr:hypothetical protein [Pseudonocardia spinosispora]